MRHGNWRQIVIDCLGMCVYLEDGELCGQVEYLEFHEIFGEDKYTQGKMQQRVLLCLTHHAAVDGAHSGVENRINKSMLMEDVSLEILLCGSYQNWIEKYNLNDSRSGCRIQYIEKQGTLV